MNHNILSKYYPTEYYRKEIGEERKGGGGVVKPLLLDLKEDKIPRHDVTQNSNYDNRSYIRYSYLF